MNTGLAVREILENVGANVLWLLVPYWVLIWVSGSGRVVWPVVALAGYVIYLGVLLPSWLSGGGMLGARQLLLIASSNATLAQGFVALGRLAAIIVLGVLGHGRARWLSAAGPQRVKGPWTCAELVILVAAYVSHPVGILLTHS